MQLLTMSVFRGYVGRGLKLITHLYPEVCLRRVMTDDRDSLYDVKGNEVVIGQPLKEGIHWTDTSQNTG
jgi:hypothetical protein